MASNHELKEPNYSHVDGEVQNGDGPVFSPDPKLEKQVLNRLDFVVLPLVAVMYFLSFLDRTNLGNARVAGLQKDLQLSDWQYQIAVTVTYVPYICAELPSNLILAKVGPRYLLPGLCIAWGVVTTLQSSIHNFAGLIACRFFLGMFEGGLIPGILVYLSGFYRRHELQLRICLFFGSSALAGAFSGLLAAAIVNMNGLRGIAGWRWIFLIEGLITVVAGIVALFLMPNNIPQVLSFKPHHASYCEARLNADRISNAVESTKFNKKGFFSTFTSVHVWSLFGMQLSVGLTFFGIAYFLPSIVATLARSFSDHPTVVQVQLLTVPPFVIAFIGALATAYVSDKYKNRGFPAAAVQLLTIVGFAMFVGVPTTNGRIRYVGVHFLVFGTYASAPGLLVWTPNNVAPYTRRVTAIAMTFIGTNIGGLGSSWIFPGSSAPAYKLGGILCLVSSILVFVFISFNTFWFMYQNKRKIEHRDKYLRGVEHLNVNDGYEKLGDRHPDFKYTP